MTPHLTLDFTTAPATRRLRRAVLAIGAATLVAGAVELVQAWEERARAQAEFAALDRRPAAGAAAARAPVSPATVRAINAVAHDLRAPWPELMRSMEASRNGDILLIQFEPVVARDSIRITADARHADAMLAYLARLEAEGLSDVLLTTHEVRQQEPGTPIRFQAQARWTRLGARTGAAKPVDDAASASAPSSDPGTSAVGPADDGSSAPDASSGSDLAALQRVVGAGRELR